MNGMKRSAIEYLQCWRDMSPARSPVSPAALVAFAHGRCIRPAQITTEFIELAKIVAKLRPRRALEIGTSSGGTLFVLCRLAEPDATIISVDLPGGQAGGGYNVLKIPLYRRFALKRQQLHLIREDSHRRETFEQVAAILKGEALDYLFIDGDHSYEGVKRDFETYSVLVRSGGVVAFHDIAVHPASRNCEVSRFWNEVKSRCDADEVIENPNQGWAGIGLVYI